MELNDIRIIRNVSWPTGRIVRFCIAVEFELLQHWNFWWQTTGLYMVIIIITCASEIIASPVVLRTILKVSQLRFKFPIFKQIIVTRLKHEKFRLKKVINSWQKLCNFCITIILTLFKHRDEEKCGCERVHVHHHPQDRTRSNVRRRWGQICYSLSQIRWASFEAV